MQHPRQQVRTNHTPCCLQTNLSTSQNPIIDDSPTPHGNSSLGWCGNNSILCPPLRGPADWKTLWSLSTNDQSVWLQCDPNVVQMSILWAHYWYNKPNQVIFVLEMLISLIGWSVVSGGPQDTVGPCTLSSNQVQVAFPSFLFLFVEICTRQVTFLGKEMDQSENRTPVIFHQNGQSQKHCPRAHLSTHIGPNTRDSGSANSATMEVRIIMKLLEESRGCVAGCVNIFKNKCRFSVILTSAIATWIATDLFDYISSTHVTSLSSYSK